MSTSHQKFTTYLLACCLLAVCGQSCKKLDTQPITAYSPGNFWLEESQASAALVGAYVLLQTALDREFIYYGEGRSDNLSGVREDNNETLNVLYNHLDPGMTYADWTRFYAVIKQANLIIHHLPIMKEKGFFSTASASTANYNRILGQAYGLRALCYFYLVRICGGVPLVLEPVDDTDDINAFKTPRADSTQVYKQISADLLTARPLLPAKYTDAMQTRAMLTQGAIDAIQTDYYLWRNNIDSALIASGQLLNSSGAVKNTNYSLVELHSDQVDYLANPGQIDNSPYAQMFISGFSSESIFEVAFNNDENTTSGFYGLFGGQGVAQFGISDKLLASFDPNDIRPLASVKSDRYIYKYFPKANYDNTTENDKDVIVYRLADIMLLRAEALNASGARDDAFVLVNMTRKRAGLTAISAAEYNAYTVEEAEDVILDERAKELCFEGKRWYDLVRTGRAIRVMEPINGLAMPENLLWPISTSVLRQNPTIVQNPYYQ